MNTELQIFLESDLLERYLLGTTNTLEDAKVEYYLSKYPQAKSHYNELQGNLELYAKSFAKPAPQQVKEQVMAAIRKEVHTVPAPGKRYSWLNIAAVAAVLIFGSSSIYLWNQNQFLTSVNDAFASEVDNLKNELVFTNANLENIKSKYALLNNPETQKYVLNGNQRAKKLKTVAYINPKEKLSLINVVSLPDIEEDQVFQMWANVNGKMVSLGVLEKADKKLLSLPYQDNISSYNITIEPKGYKGQATVENMVATIDLNQN